MIWGLGHGAFTVTDLEGSVEFATRMLGLREIERRNGTVFLTEGKADAALAASIFHYNEYDIPTTKAYLAGQIPAGRVTRPVLEVAQREDPLLGGNTIKDSHGTGPIFIDK